MGYPPLSLSLCAWCSQLECLSIWDNTDYNTGSLSNGVFPTQVLSKLPNLRILRLKDQTILGPPSCLLKLDHLHTLNL